MIDHAAQFVAAGIPFIFDPGQGMPMFGGDDLRNFVTQATWVTLNDYESRLLCERTGWTEMDVASRVKALVVTRGAQGSTVFTAGRRIDIPPVKPAAVRDPTGCGDAYRAGILFGLLRGMPWEAAGRLASLIGAIKIAAQGTQNHHFSLQSIVSAYRSEFGHALPL
jgi:adenosine kinase